jgi:hypothetical protein
MNAQWMDLHTAIAAWPIEIHVTIYFLFCVGVLVSFIAFERDKDVADRERITNRSRTAWMITTLLVSAVCAGHVYVVHMWSSPNFSLGMFALPTVGALQAGVWGKRMLNTR